LIILIIPAYNEEHNIRTLLTNIASAMERGGWAYRVIVVNDGSRDNTVGLVESFKPTMPVTVVSHERNMGVGQVFRTGFEEALKAAGPDDVLVTMEADNTSDIHILHTMLRRLEDGYDLVLASCYAQEGAVVNTSLYRRTLSLCANGLIRVLFGLKGIRTYSSFYRAYRASVMQRAVAVHGANLITEPGFACMVELLIKLNRLGVRICEVPMVLNAQMRKGRSKMKTLRTILGYLRVIAKTLRTSRHSPTRR